MVTRIAAAVMLFALCAIAAALGLLVMAVYAATNSRRALNMAIAYDQVANTIFAGQPDEMISAKAYRIRAKRAWPMRLIDWLFRWAFGQAEHCRLAFEAEKNRRQLPESYGRDTP